MGLNERNRSDVKQPKGLLKKLLKLGLTLMLLGNQSMIVALPGLMLTGLGFGLLTGVCADRVIRLMRPGLMRRMGLKAKPQAPFLKIWKRVKF